MRSVLLLPLILTSVYAACNKSELQFSNPIDDALGKVE
jgi:hypothetical protein